MRSPVLTVEGGGGDIGERRCYQSSTTTLESNRIVLSFLDSSSNATTCLDFFSLPFLSLLFLSSILEITNAVKSEVEINLG